MRHNARKSRHLTKNRSAWQNKKVPVSSAATYSAPLLEGLVEQEIFGQSLTEEHIQSLSRATRMPSRSVCEIVMDDV